MADLLLLRVLLLQVAFEMQQTEVDPEQIEKQKKLWKLFGRQTKAGKQLFSMYNLTQKPKINYPKPKPKSQKQIEQQKAKQLSSKVCPQKTEIQYPELPRKQGPKYHAVDFIPKRKNELVIREQIDEYYQRRAKDIPANRGVNRANLVRKLQDKFKMQRGILPKDATLPGVEKMDYDEEKIKEQAKRRVDKKAQTFSNPLKNSTQDQSNKAQKDLKDELNELFDQIVAEIDDRQKYLESISHLDEPKLKEKTKKEIVERIAELQRITELKGEKK